MHLLIIFFNYLSLCMLDYIKFDNCTQPIITNDLTHEKRTYINICNYFVF